MIERDDDCDAPWAHRHAFGKFERTGTYLQWISWYLYSCHRPIPVTDPSPMADWLDLISKGLFIIEDDDD